MGFLCRLEAKAKGISLIFDPTPQNNFLKFFWLSQIIFFLDISHKVKNAQSSLYPKFQIILCKTDIAPKRILFGGGWFEMGILGKKAK